MSVESEPIAQLQEITSNGKTVIFGVLIASLVGITVLAALHDIDSNAVVAIYSAIIGGGIGHLSGTTNGKLQAENGRLKSELAKAKGDTTS